MIRSLEWFLERIVIDENGCWLWQRYIKPDGYGQIADDKHSYRAHRVAYESLVGPIPGGDDIDHICSVRACINPEHLQPLGVTPNRQKQKAFKGSGPKTECPQGHPYDEENTCITPQGYKTCKLCRYRRSTVHQGGVPKK